jgi:hypothetical protein
MSFFAKRLMRSTRLRIETFAWAQEFLRPAASAGSASLRQRVSRFAGLLPSLVLATSYASTDAGNQPNPEPQLSYQDHLSPKWEIVTKLYTFLFPRDLG